MVGLIVLGSSAVLILYIWLMYYIANQFEQVANDKGYTDKKYFWICFWLGMIGYIMVAAMPYRAEKVIAKNKKAVTYELPEI